MSCRQAVPLIFLLSFLITGCDLPLLSRFIARTIDSESGQMQRIRSRITDPVLPDVGVSILWIGHASVLIQIHDKIFLTDPVFTNTVGMVSRRLTEPGIDPASLRQLDYILVSHTHFDHLNYSSLSGLPRNARLLIPEGAAEFVPDFGFQETMEMKPWSSFENDGVRITAVPTQHFSGRYGFDIPWHAGKGCTGYVIQYNGRSVYFAGDTGYRDSLFIKIGQRFDIDVALLPIAPLEPRALMNRVHLDPVGALQAFEELHAKLMVPIHHRTFPLGLEQSASLAQEELERTSESRGIRNRVCVLEIGERKILMR